MPLLLTYILKLSISLAVVYLFYQLVLRRLTFYNSNRWYLLGYTLICFFIPFVNISSFIDPHQSGDNTIVRFIPAIETYTNKIGNAIKQTATISSSVWDKWDWVLLGITIGSAFLMLHFFIRFFSFLQLRRKARLISVNGIKLYHVNESIIPFSFGNSVFVNSQLHSEEELEEIIRHEFVHVKQKHSIDIIWGEILCMINWYNPFAWLLKAAIRRNLEFIADNKVLENGFSKKQYQYLLLKVTGNNRFSIAQNFNFSSLKKRIAMMNKMKTARIHLLRFLFILPLLAVILVSFRPKKQDAVKPAGKNYTGFFASADTIPEELNEKGYFVEVTGNKKNATVVVKDKNGKLVERIAYNKWKDNEKFYEDKYGEWQAPPIPPVPPTPPTPPQPIELPDNVKKINVNDKKAIVVLKDGSVEKYDLDKPDEKAAFEKKYGEIPPPPPPPLPPRNRHELSATQEINRTTISNDFEVTDKKAVMRLKDGTKEVYDLTNTAERKKYEDKYGKIVSVGSDVPGVIAPVRAISTGAGNSVIASMNPEDGGVIWLDSKGQVITGEEEILVTITKNTTPDQLEQFKKQMKEKGIELKYENVDYNDGILASISGTMKSKDGHSNFVATDFNKLTLSMIRYDGRSYFKVNTTDKRVVL